MPRGFNPSSRGYPISTTVSNSISNIPQGGGNKLQGLPPSTSIPSNLNKPFILSRTYNTPIKRTQIVCMNTLSGVGKGRSQFNSSADGINCITLDCCEKYINSIYKIPDFHTCLDLTVIYMPIPALYTDSQCVVDILVSLGGPVLWFRPQGFRYTGNNVLSTGTIPQEPWNRFDFLLSQLPDIYQIWAPDYYAALPNYANDQGDPCTSTTQGCSSCADFGGMSPTYCSNLIVAAVNKYYKTYPNQFYLDNINGMQQSNGLAEVQNHGGDSVFPIPSTPPLNPQWWFYSAVGSGIFTSMGSKKLIALNKFHAIQKARDAGFLFKYDNGGTTRPPSVKEMLIKAQFFYSQFISDIGGTTAAQQTAFKNYLNDFWSQHTSLPADADGVYYTGWRNLLCGANDDAAYDARQVNSGTYNNPFQDAKELWTLFTAGTFTDDAPDVWELQPGKLIDGKSTFGIDTLLNYLTINNFSASGVAYDMIQMISQPNKQGGFCVEMITSKNPTFFRYNGDKYIPCPNLNNKVQKNEPFDCLFCEGLPVTNIICSSSIF